jgi:hypothetical protein
VLPLPSVASTAPTCRLQSRIMTMLKTWCQRFFVFGDFDEAAFADAFFSLLDKFESIQAMQRVAVALKSDLLSRLDRECAVISVAGTPPPIIYPHDKFTAYYKFDKTFRLQMWPTEEVARQLSLYEFSIFRKIQPKEMLNQAWSKKTREQFAPNVTADIVHFNVISSLVQYSIVSVADLQQRQRMCAPHTSSFLSSYFCTPANVVCMLGWWIKLAVSMQRLNNHSGVMQILSALQSSSVFRYAAHPPPRSEVTVPCRLKHTWNGVREQEDTDYCRLALEYSRDNNYDALRGMHNCAPPPIVPFLGMCVSRPPTHTLSPDNT